MSVAVRGRSGMALVFAVVLGAGIVCGAQTDLESGNIAYWRSSYTDAETYYTTWLDANPGSPVGFNNRGLSRYHQGNFAGADADFDAAKALDATYLAPYINKGRSLAAQRKLAGAVAEYQAGLALSPNNPKLLFGLGWIYDELGQYAQAIAQYDAALAADAGYHRARGARAVTLAKQEQKDNAILAFYDVINTVAEGDFQASLAAYNMQLLRGNGLNFVSATAAQDYRDAVFMLSAGLYGPAVPLLQQAQDAEPGIPDIPWMRAWCHMLRRDPASQGDAALQASHALMPVFSVTALKQLTPYSNLYIDGICRGTIPCSVSVFSSPHEITLRHTSDASGNRERTIIAHADGTPGGESPITMLPGPVNEFSPFAPETDVDKDWLGDDWERLHFGSLSVNSSEDPDGDDLANLYEYRFGTLPLGQDTDGDGYTDGGEVAYAGDLDPLLAAGPDFMPWRDVCMKVPWTARSAHTSVVHGGKIWIIGGSGGTHSENDDVWSSPDGVNWTQVTNAAPWAARSGHSSVVHGGKIWVIGGGAYAGFNDVWSSPDGLNWTQVTNAAPWKAREGHTSVVHDGKIWVIGGYDGRVYLNDVWSSPDGVNWTQVTGVAPWNAGAGHTSVVHEGRIWVIGGSFHRSVWSSPDGVNWTQVTSDAPWRARWSHTSVVHDGKIWVIGGYDGGYHNDVWRSTDGVNWTKVTDPAPWSAREGHTSLVYADSILVIGGSNFGNRTIADVWVGGQPDINRNFISDGYENLLSGQHSLNVSVVGSGTVTRDPLGATYYAGTDVTLTAEPVSGWIFDHWEGDLTGSTNPANITMSSERNVTAVFVEISQPVLSVTPFSLEVDAVAGSATFNIANTGDGTLTWSASDNADWVTLGGAGGTGNGTIMAAYEANLSMFPRTCSITVTATGATGSPATVSITQAGLVLPVAAPAFSPAPGTYASAQSVTLSCATEGATIRYTTNGADPTEASPQYTAPIPVSTTTTIKAKAWKTGWTPSAVSTGAYTITGTAATPAFSPAPGTYASAQSVTLSCATEGATIRYTTNGADPTEASPQYTAPIPVSTTTTIKAKAWKTGWTPSAVATGAYTIMETVATPTFAPAPGTYTSPQSVTIACTTTGATVRYTTNGTDPTESSPAYAGPISVPSTVTIKARAWKAGWTPSAVATGIYVVGETVTVPTIPVGPAVWTVSESLFFNTGGSACSLGHAVQYQFDWGNGVASDWGPASQSVVFDSVGTFTVRVRARCASNNFVVSDWSGAATVVVEEEEVRPVCGCQCAGAKGLRSILDVKRWLGDLMLAGVSMTVLLALAAGRPRRRF